MSFDTRYALTPYSNELFANFGIEALDLAAAPAEAITVRGTGGDIMRGIALGVATDFVARAYKLAYHEFGHGTRAASFGFRPYFGHGALPTIAEADQTLASGGLDDDFFGYFLGSFYQGGGYTYLPDANVLFAPADDAELEASGFDLIWNAGGLNNEMLITERLEDRIRRGGGHAGMLSSWARGKITATIYGRGKRIGDVNAILDWYDLQGHDFEQGDLRQGSMVSLLFSATTYELLYRFGRVFGGDPIRYEPWAPFGIELPNVGFFLTTSGLSYRVSSGYRRGRWRFPVAVERVFDGDTRMEYTLGGEWGPGPYYLAASLTVGEQIGVALSVDRRVGDRLLVSGGYTLYDARNLSGERLIPSLESGPRYHDLFLRLGVVY